MSSIAQEMPATKEGQPSFPVFKDRREMEDFSRVLGFKKLEEFESALGSVQQREKLVEALRKRDPHLNGQVDALIKHLKINRQEIRRKESWYEKVMKLPGRVLKKSWETVKKHPFASALLLAALAAGTVAGSYYLAAHWEGFLARFGVTTAAKAAQALGPATKIAPQVDLAPFLEGPQAEGFIP